MQQVGYWHYYHAHIILFTTDQNVLIYFRNYSIQILVELGSDCFENHSSTLATTQTAKFWF